MLAVQFSRFGIGAEVAELIDRPDPPPPGAGEIAIDILVSPVNPSDLLFFGGQYGATPPPLPGVAGYEAICRVAAVGPGVTHLKPGDRVLGHYAGRGNWCQRRVVKAEPFFALPEGGDTLQLGMMSTNPSTAWLLLTDVVPVAAGEWIIQNAANSGVGQCVIQIARTLGIKTINLVRREDQIAPLKALGGDVVMVDGPDLAQRVEAATGGVRPKLAFDCVAGAATGRLAAAVAPRGSVAVYGLMSGSTLTVEVTDVLFRHVTIRNCWFGAWTEQATPADRRKLYERMFALVAGGQVRVPVEATYPLERINEALAHAARPGRSGKILILPNGPQG